MIKVKSIQDMGSSRAYKLATVGGHVVNCAKIESNNKGSTIPAPVASGTETDNAEVALHLTTGWTLEAWFWLGGDQSRSQGVRRGPDLAWCPIVLPALREPGS